MTVCILMDITLTAGYTITVCPVEDQGELWTACVFCSSSASSIFILDANVNSFVNCTEPEAKALKDIFCNLSDLLSGSGFSHY